MNKKSIVTLLAAMSLVLLPCTTCFAETGFPTGSHVKVVNCEEFISLRETPSADGAVLARIPRGAYLPFICDDDENDDYAYVSYEGESGYVRSEFLSLTEDFSGDEVDLTGDARRIVNIFLSKFSEQYFVFSTGFFDRDVDYNGDMTNFAVNYCWFHNKDAIDFSDDEDEDYPWYGDNTRVSADYIPDITDRYFDREPDDLTNSIFDYRDGYYYWQETGGNTRGGHACLYDIEYFGNDMYSVRFKVASADSDWSDDECSMTLDEAEDDYDLVSGDGFALIFVGDDLDDGKTFRMVRYAWAK